jgi:hypothetical protein
MTAVRSARPVDRYGDARGYVAVQGERVHRCTGRAARGPRRILVGRSAGAIGKLADGSGMPCRIADRAPPAVSGALDRVTVTPS